MKTQIRESMAKAFFAAAWADWQDKYGDGVGMGVEIMDVIPDEYPQSAYDAADKLITGMEKINGMSIERIFEICRDEPGDHRGEPDEDEFGHYMAMQSMGHGVSWDDNHPSMFYAKRIDWVEPKINRPQVFKVPSIEFSYFDLPESEYPLELTGEQ